MKKVILILLLIVGWSTQTFAWVADAAYLAIIVGIGGVCGIGMCGIDYNDERVAERRKSEYGILAREGLAFSRVLTSPLNVLISPVGMPVGYCESNSTSKVKCVVAAPFVFVGGVLYGSCGTVDEVIVGATEILTTTRINGCYYPWESYAVSHDFVNDYSVHHEKRKAERANREVKSEKSVKYTESSETTTEVVREYSDGELVSTKRITTKKPRKNVASKQIAAKDVVADEKRIAEEKESKRRDAAEKRAAEEKRIAEKKRIAEEKKVAEEKRIAEGKRIDEEKRVAEEKRKVEEEQKRIEEEQAKKIADTKQTIEQMVRESTVQADDESSVRGHVACHGLPTAAEINTARPRIDELTRNDCAALNVRRKSSEEKADALLSCIAADDSTAFKFVIRQMAFRRYLVGSAFGKAYKLYSAVHGENGVGYALEMVGQSRHRLDKRTASGKTAELLLTAQILADEKSVKTVIAIRKLLEKSPKDELLHELLAYEYVACGDWESAIAAFRDCAGEISKVAGWEMSDRKDDSYDAWKIASFWWDLAETRFKGDERIAENIKVHSASWCRKALALNILSELDAKLAVWRVNKCETFKANMLVKERQENGLYMIVDLAKKGGRAVSYLYAEPNDGWGDEFKTSKIVLRRISPGSFELSPGSEVKITKPFYMGVFEMTQRQYELIMGTNPSEFKGSMRPVESVQYRDIRGAKDGQGWPKDNKVDGDSCLGRLRKRIGPGFDLPTEAQWEYACRAGTYSDFNVNGSDMKELGKCRDNGGQDEHHAKVGSYQPNVWGLYDMHGNVWELCLDRYGESRDAAVDPVGPAEGSRRVLRGGGWDAPAVECRSSHRNDVNPGLAYGFIGFRLSCPAEEERRAILENNKETR